MSEGVPDDTSEYADEGTAAHHLATLTFAHEQKRAHAFLNRTMTVVNGVVYELGDERPPKLEGQSEDIERFFRADHDMCRYVQMYVSNVLDYQRGCNGMLFVEQRVPIGHLTGEEGAEGTSDAVIISEDGEELQVHDLKFGRGVEVSAEDNRQMKVYALGVLHKYEMLGDFKRIVLVIHQPRINSKPDEWSMTREALDAFAEEVTEAAKLVGVATEFKANWMPGATAPSLTYLNVSEKACRFCKGAGKPCPALEAKVQEETEHDFEDLTAEALTVPEGDDSALRLSRILMSADMIEEFLKACRKEAERRLLNGEEIPEHKVVQGKMGNRYWKDEAQVEELMKKSMRLRDDQMYNFKLISPAGAESVLSETPKRWTRLQELIGQNEGKLGIAHVSDKRPAIEVQATDDAFEDETAEASAASAADDSLV